MLECFKWHFSHIDLFNGAPDVAWWIIGTETTQGKALSLRFHNTVFLDYRISREKFEPEPGFEPRTSGFLARRSTTWAIFRFYNYCRFGHLLLAARVRSQVGEIFLACVWFESSFVRNIGGYLFVAKIPVYNCLIIIVTPPLWNFKKQFIIVILKTLHWWWLI